ncbi:MAG: rRNA maturation RNase YbeY [Pseudomonadota bacterium]
MPQKIPMLRTKLMMRNEHPRMSPHLDSLKRALMRLPGNVSKKHVGIIFTDDRTISKLAGEFRASPYPTDVLAFSYEDDPRLMGEVVISLDTAKRQAIERGVLLEQELLLLSVHGLLHIYGYGDETRKDWYEMKVKEFEMMVRIL